MPPALALRGITKSFGPVQALDEVDFSLEPGEIHALLGENGAGKSTLMKIAFGLIKPDAGRISIAGTPISLRNPTDARLRGIGMVHQHFTSIPAFTVAENVALAAGWRLTPRVCSARVRQLAAATGFAIDPGLRVADLSAGLKQRLEVLKALAGDARILLLDEPTSVLSPPDAEGLLQQITEFRSRGVATVLITHKLREAIAIADRVTVLRRGRVVHAGPVHLETPESLASHMLGQSSGPTPAPLPHGGPAGEVRISARNLVVDRLGGSGTGLREATLTVHAGELVGLAAVEGNGQRELFRALAGLAAPVSGTLNINGPVAFIPEDRTSEALIGEFTLTENLVLSQRGVAPWVAGPWIDWRRAQARATELIAAHGVRAGGASAEAGSLSGGNQQRLVVAEALERRPGVLLAENPTRGLDFRAAREVMDRLKAAAQSGVAVLVHLADLDELLSLASRIVVLSDGRMSELPSGASRDQIGRRMLGAPVP
jgi:general nucleoside transport system ATP-binding protein